MANEKRLIDANALRQNIESQFYWMTLNPVSALEEIDNAPTVDAVEVVHSEWVMIGDDYAHCPNCDHMFEMRPTPMFFKENNKYCRNCGAKMDGERKENA
jgi:hypothetical protein